jgi:hypothetical protein
VAVAVAVGAAADGRAGVLDGLGEALDRDGSGDGEALSVADALGDDAEVRDADGDAPVPAAADTASAGASGTLARRSDGRAEFRDGVS